MASDALTEAIVTVLQPLNPPVANLREQIEQLVAGHGLEEDPPRWMVDFFVWVAEGHEVFRLEVPWEYPRGEGGLANLMIEIHDGVCPLQDYDDQGEAWYWRYEPSQVVITLDRESGANVLLTIRRHSSGTTG